MKKHKEQILNLISNFGYWSEEVKDFNGQLVKLKGFGYMQKINLPFLGTKNSK